MKKSPIKVIIRMRPTSNFAHKNMHVDEETGYLFHYVGKSIFMFRGIKNKELLIINKINGDSNSRKFSLMLRNN